MRRSPVERVQDAGGAKEIHGRAMKRDALAHGGSAGKRYRRTGPDRADPEARSLAKSRLKRTASKCYIF